MSKNEGFQGKNRQKGLQPERLAARKACSQKGLQPERLAAFRGFLTQKAPVWGKIDGVLKQTLGLV
ncbi:hypothetical protein [Acutalibacter caecimuris]|uniref:hypothetical protein n=1 Tax=Acutalibacter caecimuris TaxID=3093657 RepID=UPI002AC904F4|nr:hypothetical protein [Acutalibacter sp. M00118]